MADEPEPSGGPAKKRTIKNRKDDSVPPISGSESGQASSPEGQPAQTEINSVLSGPSSIPAREVSAPHGVLDTPLSPSGEANIFSQDTTVCSTQASSQQASPSP